MKNTMKNHVRSAAKGSGADVKVLEVAVDAVTEGGAVRVCDNLMRDEARGGVCVAEAPEAVAEGAWRPLARYHHAPGGEGASTLMARKSGEGIWTVAVERGGEWREVMRRRGEVRCALARKDGFTVVTDDGCTGVEYDAVSDRWRVSQGQPVPPPLTLTAKGAGALTAWTSAVDLNGVTYAGGSYTVPAAGRDRVTGALLDGYDRLLRTAEESGRSVQPVIARYRLIGAEGETVYESAPVLLAPSGRQCTAEVSTTYTYSGGTLSLPAVSIEAQSYRPVLTMAAEEDMGAWRERVSRVEILVSEQWDPVDREGRAGLRFTRAGTSDARAWLRLPGVELTDKVMAERIAAALSSDGVKMRVAARMDLPAGGTEAEVTCTGGDGFSETAGGYSKNENNGDELAAIQAPNGFTAGTVMSDGDLVVWGDVTPVLAGGNNIAEMAGERADAAWRGVVRVTMNDGTQATGTFDGVTGMPVSLGPLISYPHPRARLMEVWIETDADGYAPLRHAEIPLSNAGGGMSAYVSPTLGNIALPAWEGEVPEPTASKGERRAGMIVTATVSNPLLPLSALTVSHSQVMRAVPGTGQRGSWNNTRARVAVYATDGTYRVNIDSDGRLRSASLTDMRGVARRDAVAVTPAGIVSVHPGGTVLLNGGSTVKEIELRSEWVAAAWNGSDGMVWLIDSRGNPTALDPADGHRHNPLTQESPEYVASIAGDLYLTSPDSLMRPAVPPSNATVPIHWEAEAELPERSRAAAITLHATATRLTGRVRVSALPYPGSEERTDLLRLEIDGALSRPLKARIIAPIWSHIAVRVEGFATGDFAMHNLRVCLLLTS